jgi:hypothetical protein
MYRGATTTDHAPTGNLERIILQSLWPSSAHPVRLYGRFEHGELVFANAIDLGITWTRAPDQSAEAFEIMIANALLNIRGLPALDDIDARGTRGHAPSRKFA